MEIYLVGGAVRDQLLHLPQMDKDWVIVGATPEDLLAQGYQQVGKDFPVFLHPKTKEEYALARTERKSGHGYKGFTCYAAPDVTLEDDLKRRDLTINAIAQNEAGQLIDPYQGQEDIKNRVLRHVSPAFVEDPLRVLRIARFKAQLHSFDFTIASSTEALMRDMVRSGELNALVPDRIWQEVEKALATTAPDVFFMCLRECGALAVLFPELDRLFGVPNDPKHHPEIDSGIHTLQVLKAASQLSQSNAVRFAALTHDLGKAETPMEDWPHHPEHGPRALPALEHLQKRYPIPRDYSDLARLVAIHHIACHNSLSACADTILNLLEQCDALRRPERFQLFLLACQADSSAYLRRHEKTYPAGKWLLRALHEIQQIDVKALIDNGLNGNQVAEALRQKRLAAIQTLLSNP